MRKGILALSLASSLYANELSDYVMHHTDGVVPLGDGRTAYTVKVEPPKGYVTARFQYTRSPTVEEFVLTLVDRDGSYLLVIDENADGKPDRGRRIWGSIGRQSSEPVQIRGELSKFYTDAHDMLTATAVKEQQAKRK
jgi:hypothetical protein